MRCPERRLLHVYRRIQVDRLKQARGSASGTSLKLFFTWLFYCISNTRETFFNGISLIYLSGAPDVIAGNLTLSAPVFFIVSREIPFCPCRLLFHRVQSPRNLAHSYKRPVVKLFLSTSALSAPRLVHLWYHLGPGSSLFLP